MQIFVKLLTGKVITLDVNGADTVMSVKNKLETAEKIDASKVNLIFSGNTLENEKTLDEYGVEKESTVFAIGNAPVSSLAGPVAAESTIIKPEPAPESTTAVQIKVSTITGNNFMLDVNKTDIIGDIKKSIASKYAIDIQLLMPYYKQTKLNDSDILDYAGIKDKDVIMAIYNVSGD